MNEIITKETLSKRLKELRDSTGMSLREYSDSMGFNFMTYYALEKGQRKTSTIKIHTLKPIILHFNLNPGWLIYEDCTRKYMRSSEMENIVQEIYHLVEDLPDDKLPIALTIIKALKGE